MDGIYTAEGLEDKTVVWSKYHYLVRQEALRLIKRLPASVELDDLIQAGAIGFLNAVETFDPKKLGIAAMKAVKEQTILRMKMCGCTGKVQ